MLWWLEKFFERLSWFSHFIIYLDTTVLFIAICKDDVSVWHEIYLYHAHQWTKRVVIWVVWMLFIYLSLPYATVGGDSTYVQIDELFSPDEWSKNAGRKFTVTYLGPWHRNPNNCFVTTCCDLASRVALTFISEFGSARADVTDVADVADVAQPGLVAPGDVRAVLCFIVALGWMLISAWKPLYVNPILQSKLVALRSFTVLAMGCTIPLVFLVHSCPDDDYACQQRQSLGPGLVLLLGICALVYHERKQSAQLVDEASDLYHAEVLEESKIIGEHGRESSLFAKTTALGTVEDGCLSARVWQPREGEGTTP